MDIEQAQKMIDLLVRSAPKLRDAGVTEIELGDCHTRVHLAHPEPQPLPATQPDQRSWSLDPLDDPDTFGGGRVPSYPREDRDMD